MSELPRFLSPKTLQHPDIIAGFSTREGGVSTPPFHSLNLASRDDDPGVVAENLLRFCRAGGLSRCPPAVQRQVHGRAITWIGGDDGPSPWEVRETEGDVLITRSRGIPVAVQVADCVPILLWDRRNGVVAAVHAGWRGTAVQVVQAALDDMRERAGTSPADVRAGLGPAIGGCCYEVGSEVAEAMSRAFPVEEFVTDENPLRIDLRAVNEFALRRAGVPADAISRVGGCTSCDRACFSYRRDGPRTGRMMGVIELR